MGLDIGIARGIDWSERPSAELGEKLTHIAFDEFGNASLSLSEVRETCEEYIEQTEDADEREHAQDVLNWWTHYWHEHGLAHTDSRSITFDS